jgi:hypothetical protein
VKTFKLEIKLDGHAFGMDPAWELAQRLHAIASAQIMMGAQDGTVVDTEGNTCGHFEIVTHQHGTKGL